MRCWHLYAREVRGLRVSWELSGKYMVRRRNRATLIDTFTLWRYVDSKLLQHSLYFQHSL